MRKYETIFISDPDIQDQVRDELFEKVKNIITGLDGYIIDFDDWGIKKLAYDIRKKSRGHYVCVSYGGTGELVKELERNFGLNDYVMRFMTILLSDHITMEQLEKEAEEAKNKSTKSASTGERSDDQDSTNEAHEYEDSDNSVDSANASIAEDSDTSSDSDGDNIAKDDNAQDAEGVKEDLKPEDLTTDESEAKEEQPEQSEPPKQPESEEQQS